MTVVSIIVVALLASVPQGSEVIGTDIGFQSGAESRTDSVRIESTTQNQPRDKSNGSTYRAIFEQIRDGLVSGSIGSLSRYFGPQVYVNLRGGESGYFSDNQVHYVLAGYLKARKLVSLEFSTIGETEANPFATGSAIWLAKGNREVGQVYVSLARQGNRWIISQINIY